jgi:hypothetical protein
VFYDVLAKKIKEYDILPQNTYNMDEKGFMIRVSTKQHRIFSKQAFKSGQILANI